MSTKRIDIPETGNTNLDGNGGAADRSANGGITRRRFLQVLGAGSAVGIAGCADSPRQNILPNSKGMQEQVPGVAVWYKTTCGECSAGCGLVVRTREGRAVKVEGNVDHPVNSGGVCALGQSTLQNLYDPDRLRTPVARKRFSVNGEMKNVSWDQALDAFAKSLGKGKGKQVIITGEVTGANASLIKDWCKAVGAEHVVYELSSQAVEAKAAEAVLGIYGVPTYSFDKADVVVNFGADFLETWNSPVEYARSWADSRRKKAPAKFVHVEPRLSLTGANADSWLRSNPGSEEQIVLALIKLVLERRGAGALSGLSDAVKSKLNVALKTASVENAISASGITKEQLLVVADDLSRAKNSLILVGGAASLTTQSLSLMISTMALNVILGNIGKTVNVAKVRKPRSSAKSILAAIDRLNKGELVNVIFWGTNPAFTLPKSFGLEYAVRKAHAVYALSSHVDETAALADYVLPTNVALESWGDSEPRAGVYNLFQPTMLPLFDSKIGGDVLLEVAAKAGQALSAKNFEELLKARWQGLQASSPDKSLSFDVFWRKAVGNGGFSGSDVASESKSDESVEFEFSDEGASFAKPKTGGKTLTLYPYPSVRTFDGRAANRPWLQELPDPITQANWSSWAEISTKTAKDFGLAQGDMVTLSTDHGEITVPVYLTEYVHDGIVAVPIGQGHSEYGRYAKSVGGGNVLSLLTTQVDRSESAVALLSTNVTVTRSLATGSLPNVQGSDSQHGRELARTKLVAGAVAAAGAHEAHAHEHHHDEHHHEAKQMYEQRPHPLYQWGMAIDLAACTGCSACVVACYAENNIPVVGKKVVEEGREMSWLRIERYYDGEGEELKVNFLPMMCQHCQNAPCEPVCPVYATYHNEEGLNAMVYNRCVGTRYCSNNCSYKVRRFNWFDYEVPETLSWQLNPDVTKRGVGVMEKCTFCVQRINEAKARAKDLGRQVEDGDVKPACVQSCPTQALVFGNLNDPKSKVSKISKDGRAYKVLDHHINTQPSVTYLEDIRVKA